MPAFRAEALFRALPLLLALLAPPVSGAEGGLTPGEEARRLLEQERYDEACPLYERLASEAKTDGARWADLGRCELRRGHRDAGRRAWLLAVRHGDAATRIQAYENLHASGYRTPLPDRAPGGGVSCDLLPTPAPLECGARTWACVVPWTRDGSAGVTAVFGTKPEERERWKTLPPDDPARALAGADAVQLEARGVEPSRACEVIAVDPCRGRVGYACRVERPRALPKPAFFELILR